MFSSFRNLRISFLPSFLVLILFGPKSPNSEPLSFGDKQWRNRTIINPLKVQILPEIVLLFMFKGPRGGNVWATEKPHSQPSKGFDKQQSLFQPVIITSRMETLLNIITSLMQKNDFYHSRLQSLWMEKKTKRKREFRHFLQKTSTFLSQKYAGKKSNILRIFRWNK